MGEPKFDPESVRTVGIVGGGVSGLAAGRLAASRGWAMRLWDDRPLAALDPFWRERADAAYRGSDPSLPPEVDALILSPGVPPTAPVVLRAREAGVPVVSEVELAARFLRQPIVAITGTNGKTTVTTLVGRMLEEAGLPRFVGGNIGRALSEAALEAGAEDTIVAEISSYQLEAIETFRPRVAVLLNVTADHLDRYADMEAYLAAKARVFENQGAGDAAVLFRGDPLVWGLRGAIREGVEVLSFGHDEVAEGLFARAGEILLRRGGAEERYGLAAFKPPGAHNRENAMAAVAAARLAGAPQAAVQRALDAFPGLPHRIEFVAEARGKRFYNDSKATNVDAAARALECFEGRRVALILGGRDKGGDYGPLRAAMAGRVGRAVLLGEARPILERALAGACRLESAATLEDAVRAAASGDCDTVLLSPACSSFDMFRNYAERGAAFRKAVEALVREERP